MPAPLLCAALLLAADPPAFDNLTVRMTVSPAAAPKPVLKYELLPPLRERTPGNAAVGYLRAGLSLPKPPRDRDAETARWERHDNWRSVPLDKLPAGQVADELKGYRAALRAADDAARFASCDWSLPKPTPGGTPFDDAQAVRELANTLPLRTRVELAGGRFEDANRSLQTQFQMGRHAAEGGDMIRYLVGLALTAMATKGADDWVSAPGSPSLYWALGTLPRPFCDPRPMLARDLAEQEATMPAFRAFENGPVPADEARRLVDGMRKQLAMFESLAALEGGAGNADEFIGQTMVAVFGTVAAGKRADELAGRAEWELYWLRAWGPARRALVARGQPAGVVDRMPSPQVVCLAAWLRFLEHRDEVVAAVLLPPAEGMKATERAAAGVKAAVAANDSDRLFRLLAVNLTAMAKVHQAGVRIERRLAALRAVEALRLHLADAGKLPATLADVSVAVPDDPATGKPFEYTPRADGFVLFGPPPKGEAANPSNAVRYDVTVRPAK